MDLPAEIKTNEQWQMWQAVNQCKERMQQIVDGGKQHILNAPPHVQQFIFQQLLGEMQHLASVVLNLRANCQHAVRTWREIDDSVVIDMTQCVICQENFSGRISSDDRG